MKNTDIQKIKDPKGSTIKPGRIFTMPAVVIALLTGHIVFIMIAITLATGDRSFAVVPDYYRKAVEYDQRKTMLEESDQVGWAVHLEPADTMNGTGERELIVRLTDRDGAAVTGAALHLSCYHYARAGEPVTLDLVEALPGQYVGVARVGREGFWWFDVSANREGAVFVRGFKQFVRAAEVTR